MNSILSSVFLGALLTVGSAAIAAESATDPVVGTWTLNVAKSKFSEGHALKSQTRTYSQSADGITLNMKTVGADGKETTTQTTYHLDGKDYPITGRPDFDSLSGKQISPNTASFTLKKGGKTVGTTRRTVSKDGKTLTTTDKMPGSTAVDTGVFDKQ
ncbi:MAG: hypothetical protein ABSH33_20550 [Steroidobacteraceae bacterium]